MEIHTGERGSERQRHSRDRAIGAKETLDMCVCQHVCVKKRKMESVKRENNSDPLVLPHRGCRSALLSLLGRNCGIVGKGKRRMLGFPDLHYRVSSMCLKKDSRTNNAAPTAVPHCADPHTSDGSDVPLHQKSRENMCEFVCAHVCF